MLVVLIFFYSFRLETSRSKSGLIHRPKTNIWTAMTDMKDESETLNTLEKFASLQKEISKLKQENKVLHIRAQGVEVLGNCTRTWTGIL